MNFRAFFVAAGFCALASSQVAFAGDTPAATSATTTNADFGVPVYPYDITDRPYTVLGEVHAGVRKATVFSQAPSQKKIYEVLWKHAKELGADAVIKVQYGDAHITALSWGSVSATGVAIKFIDPKNPAASPAAH